MSEPILCISPVDGSVYLERAITDDAAIEAAVARARHGQAQWARLEVSERARYCSAMVDAMLAMGEDIVPERARHMIGIAEHALADIEPVPKAGSRRYIQRLPLGIVLVVAPWNSPTSPPPSGPGIRMPPSAWARISTPVPCS